MDLDIFGILFPRSFNDHHFYNEDGCLLKYGHLGPHICRNERNQLHAWQDEETCGCGCWETEDFQDVCKVFRQITEEELQEELNKS